MFLELAVGDAYGAGFEGADAAFVASGNDLSGYRANPVSPIGSGRYTDDTQMTLAVAEVIVDDAPWTPAELANRFVEVFKRDPRMGYTSCSTSS